jgi:DNA repair protein SbcD/Mre11
VDLTGLGKLDQVIVALQKTVEDHRPESSQQGTVLRVTLTGRGPVHLELKLPGTLDELLEEMQHQGRSLKPWVWVESLSAATGQDFDLAALSQGQNLTATILSHLAEAREKPALPGEVQKILEPLFKHPMARRYLPEAPAWPEVLDEVTAELLGRLLREED